MLEIGGPKWKLFPIRGNSEGSMLMQCKHCASWIATTLWDQVSHPEERGQVVKPLRLLMTRDMTAQNLALQFFFLRRQESQLKMAEKAFPQNCLQTGIRIDFDLIRHYFSCEGVIQKKLEWSDFFRVIPWKNYAVLCLYSLQLLLKWIFEPH